MLREEEQRGREERRKWVSLEVHNGAVKECQEAFDELKRNYKREAAENEKHLEELQRETAGLKSNLESITSANIQLDTDVKLNAKMAHKFEELSLSLQVENIFIFLIKSQIPGEGDVTRSREDGSRPANNLAWQRSRECQGFRSILTAVDLNGKI